MISKMQGNIQHEGVKNMDFIIFYEHINRELENVLLIKYELERRGYSVVLSHFSGCSYGRYVLFSKPKVIITPWLRNDENMYRFTRFRNENNKIVNLQWEQIYSNKVLDSGLAMTSGTATKAYHVCWGTRSRDRLIDQGVSPDKIRITGAIQMDFCRKEFGSYYKSKEEISKEFDIDVTVPWSLYVSSYSYATYDLDSIQSLEKNFNTSLTDMVEVSKESKKITLAWIDSLLCENKNMVFIYRTHPSENIDETLIELSKKHPNFRIIHKYSVKQWIKICDIINTWFSTTVGEIYFMNKTCHIIRPIPLPRDIEVEIMREAVFITDKKTFIEINMKDTENRVSFPIKPETIYEFYDQNGQVPSYVRVADFFEEVCLNDKGVNYHFSKEKSYKFKKKYRNAIIVSIFIDIVAKTGIRLSKIIPFKKRVFRNCEKWIERKKIITQTENQLWRYARNNYEE